MNEDSGVEDVDEEEALTPSDDGSDMIVDDDDEYAHKIREEEAGEQQAANMPTIRDPKLWQVNVAKGSEQLMTMSLMNK